MKTFLEWMLKAITGALAVSIFLAAASSRVFPLTAPLLTVGGRKLVLNLPDAVSFIVIVLLGAIAFYIIGYSIGKAMSFLWSKFAWSQVVTPAISASSKTATSLKWFCSLTDPNNPPSLCSNNSFNMPFKTSHNQDTS